MPRMRFQAVHRNSPAAPRSAMNVTHSPAPSREMNAARYLNWRINRQVNAEDTVLIEGVQQGMESSSYATGPLSPSEVCLISFGNRMRDLIPEANLERAPA